MDQGRLGRLFANADERMDEAREFLRYAQEHRTLHDGYTALGNVKAAQKARETMRHFALKWRQCIAEYNWWMDAAAADRKEAIRIIMGAVARTVEKAGGDQ